VSSSFPKEERIPNECDKIVAKAKQTLYRLFLKSKATVTAKDYRDSAKAMLTVSYLSTPKLSTLSPAATKPYATAKIFKTSIVPLQRKREEEGRKERWGQEQRERDRERERDRKKRNREREMRMRCHPMRYLGSKPLL
jgi:hypothetical protein